jgi:hypothetical protein
MEISPTAWQPFHELWTLEQLNYEHSILLGMSIDHSTSATYSSALNLYLTVSISIPDLSTHIYPESATNSSRTSPKSVKTENHRLLFAPWPVQNVIGANLVTISTDLSTSTLHDDLLFHAQLNTGFTGLLRLGELTWPDTIHLRDYKKVSMRFSLKINSYTYSFWLPANKADTTFEGNHIVVKEITGAPDPCPIMQRYINSRDVLFPFHPQLWLKLDGTISLLLWFLRCLHHYFGSHIDGQSL